MYLVAVVGGYLPAGIATVVVAVTCLLVIVILITGAIDVALSEDGVGATETGAGDTVISHRAVLAVDELMAGRQDPIVRKLVGSNFRANVLANLVANLSAASLVYLGAVVGGFLAANPAILSLVFGMLAFSSQFAASSVTRRLEGRRDGAAKIARTTLTVMGFVLLVAAVVSAGNIEDECLRSKVFFVLTPPPDGGYLPYDPRIPTC